MIKLAKIGKKGKPKYFAHSSWLIATIAHGSKLIAHREGEDDLSQRTQRSQRIVNF
jgi:hypothetical protein